MGLVRRGPNGYKNLEGRTGGGTKHGVKDRDEQPSASVASADASTGGVRLCGEGDEAEDASRRTSGKELGRAQVRRAG